MVLEEWITTFQEWATWAVNTLGYFGVFLVSFVGNASIIFPVPSILIVFFAGAVLNPWIVGLAAGAGSALGEFVGYMIGRGGREVAEKKNQKWLKRTKNWVKKRGVFTVLVLFALTPLPDDIAGITAGLLKYDWKKFLLAGFIGKTVLCTIVAFAGLYGSEAVLNYFLL